MPQLSMKFDESLLKGIPQQVKNCIPQNLQERSPFIKMKRLAQIDDSLLIINQQMSLNVSFTSPILESLQYLQQHEKYRLRGILSSFPLSTKQFDQYYNDIQSIIMLKYKSNITSMMKIVYELINVAGCEKVNEMKMYSEMLTKIKDQLLLNRSNTDVYGFNTSQFDHDKETVKNILTFSQKYLNLHNYQPSESLIMKQHQELRFEIKKHLESLTNKIKSTTIKMMDKMNDCQIQQPYIPQNHSFQKIDINHILSTYWKKMKIHNISVEEQLAQKRKSVQTQVKKLYQEGLIEYKQDSLNFAQQIINKYNQNCKELQNNSKLRSKSDTRNNLGVTVFNEQNKRPFNVTDINDINFEDKSQNKSAIKDIRKQVKFNNQIKFIQLESKNQYIFQIKNSKKFPNNFYQQQNEQNQIRVKQIKYNPSVNPFLMKENNKSIIALQNYSPHNKNVVHQIQRNKEIMPKKILSHSQNMERLEKEFNELKRKQEQSNKINFKKQVQLKFNSQFYNGKSWIIQKLFGLNEKSNELISNQHNKNLQNLQTNDLLKPFMKKKTLNDQPSQVQIKEPNVNTISDHKYIYFKSVQQKNLQSFGNFSILSNQQKSRLQLSHQNYQKQKMIEYQRKIQSLIIVIRMKTYQKFCSLSINPKTKKGGLELKTYLTNQKSYRYGIQIQTNLQKYFTNSNQNSTQNPSVAIKLPPSKLQQLNKYFFYTFKQLHYRFNKKIEENSQIPILMTLGTEQQILNEKMIKNILTLMKKYDFFILWTLGDLIFYEQKIQFGHRKASITIVMFWGTERIARGMIWQLKKRIDEKFKQDQNEPMQKDGSKKNQNHPKQLKYSLEESFESYFMHSQKFAQNKETINEIFTKIQFVHRKIFDRHKRPLTLDKIFSKGKQLWKQLIQRKWQK